jgi:hypothetical protein
LRCGLDSEYSGFERISTATGWFLINSSISREISSSGVYIESVSSSEGGLMKPFAALKAGVAVMTKPPAVKTTAIVRNPKARLIKERLGGLDSGAVSSRKLAAIRCLAVCDEPCTDLRGALVPNLCERRRKEEVC